MLPGLVVVAPLFFYTCPFLNEEMVSKVIVSERGQLTRGKTCGVRKGNTDKTWWVAYQVPESISKRRIGWFAVVMPLCQYHKHSESC